jgi:hypothetical protein
MAKSKQRFTNRTPPEQAPTVAPEAPQSPEAPPDAFAPPPAPEAPQQPVQTFQAPIEQQVLAREGRHVVVCVADPHEWPDIRSAALTKYAACVPVTSIPMAALMEGDRLSAGFCIGRGPLLPPSRRGEGDRAPYITEPIEVRGEYWGPSHTDGLALGAPVNSKLLERLGQDCIPYRGAYGCVTIRVKDGALSLGY